MLPLSASEPEPSRTRSRTGPGTILDPSSTRARAIARGAAHSDPGTDMGGTDADTDTSSTELDVDVRLRLGMADQQTQPEPEPTSPTSPLAPYPPILPTESRSRAPEFYGFVAWTSTYLLFFLYLLWAFLPDDYILAIGVSWYPNREWSLLVPAYAMMLVLLTYFTYFALAFAGTPAFSDIRTITDSKAHLPSCSLPSPLPAPGNRDGENAPPPKPEPNFKTKPENAGGSRLSSLHEPDPAYEPGSHLESSHKPAPRAQADSKPNPYLPYSRPDAIPELYDIPLGMVNRVVYGSSRRVPGAGSRLGIINAS